MSAVLHDFQASLARSHEFEDAPWWEPVYRKAFPGFRAMTSVRADGWAQRGGIDRVIVLRSGKTLSVDEKVRERDWNDILLERWSDKARRSPGWIQKDLACDYIAYAFIPSQTCYLLPFQQLRAAWINHGRDWIEKAESQSDGFRVIKAINRGYVTESIAIPKPILFSALRSAMSVKWEAP